MFERLPGDGVWLQVAKLTDVNVVAARPRCSVPGFIRRRITVHFSAEYFSGQSFMNISRFIR